ncbi:DHA2 family efflux MFS transporter permease subunit [Undibacterium oligocarboniphilum]|uniref:DHA2 family efflux MFS transporter permease subunit n=1 Tax=Undibacterium oligocarboniphilum TaxID=666702 RepID=A0A850QCS5_9BURK|nr:DHA2 family efflux MFS transporter permease subunit [Undibacterium oligocarboniphilum]MBC3868667.1 DHA2 family efflux MFS transporter permease subunit [Undibacterium oligocarboniphilum]NVO76647.1 DHA2 family efflux MFS transporter permease subunit [Undibacterium oligocarboniphilum]
MSTASRAPYAPLKGSQLAMGTLALSLAVFMNVLDSSIANVSIPAISGNLGVSPQQGTWVITSFAVANAISVPLTGWLTTQFGQVRLFMASILLFVISSWLCGMAPNIEMLIAARILQGAVAGPMIPLSQALLLGSYPPAKSSMALALWGMTTLVAPIMGPLLGGWISDNYSWPWIFYINIPVGLFTAWATWSIYRKRESAIKALPIDKVGLFLLVVWVGALQLMLDKGKELDWFSSGEIILLTVVAVIGFIYFVIWETGQDHPVVDLSLFKGRNFSAGVVAISIGYGLFFGSLVIMPLWLQTQLSYTATEAGKVMAPVGIFAILLSPVIGKILPKVDARKVASVAFLGFALVFFLRAGFTTEVDTITLLIPTLLQGAAMSMFFIPLTSIILSGQPPDKIPAASGLSNFVRIMCGGMGASIMTTMWDSRSTMHHAHITEHTGSSSQLFVQTVQGLNQQGIPDAGAYALIDRIISVQASTMAATDLFYMAAFMFLGLIGLVWLTKPKKSSIPVDAGGAH